MKLSKKYSIKIPPTNKILYVSNLNMIIVIGSVSQKLYKLNLKVVLNDKTNILYVTNKPICSSLKYKKKFLKSLQGTVTASLKQIVLETSTMLNCKLHLYGVGYKVFLINMSNCTLLQFNLGFSHLIFLRLIKNVDVFCLKSNNLLIFGNSLKQITQFGFQIRSYKYPESYKGKGILYNNEKIKLKSGKKV